MPGTRIAAWLTLGSLLSAGIAGCGFRQSEAVSPCKLTTATEVQNAVGETVLGPTPNDGTPDSMDREIYGAQGVVAHHRCTYKGISSDLKVDLDVMQFTNNEAARQFYNRIEGLSVKSPAITHPAAGPNARAMQVAGPRRTSTYVLKNDVFLMLEVYEPGSKTDTAQEASLALLPRLVDRLR